MLITLCTLFFLVAAVHSTKKGFLNTTDGFHWFLVFDTPILLANTSIDAKPYDLVWGASDLIIPMYRESNPEIVVALYIPWARDHDGNNNISYWTSFHPDWVLYKCDRVTPAFGFNDPHIPLDTSNPEVIEWQISKYVNMTKQFGYDGIAADNFALGNAVSACGVWNKDGEWVQKYTGNWIDEAYANTAMYWVRTFSDRLKQEAPDISFGINFSLNGASPTDPIVTSVTDHVDYILDEAGYTNWGTHYPDADVWEDINVWIEGIQREGKHYFGINEFAELTREAKEWGMASYLMSKNSRSSAVCTLIQGYGFETKMTEYDDLKIGRPLGPRYSSDGLYMRQYSNGLAFVNPTPGPKNYTLPDDGITYRDVEGAVYNPGQTVSFWGQTGTVMGVTGRVTTVTSTTTTSTSSSTTGGTSTLSSSTSTSSSSSSSFSSSSSSSTSSSSSSTSSSSTTAPPPPEEPTSAATFARFSSFLSLVSLLSSLLFLL